MDIAFRHTPYDGSATPFTIGLKPIDPARWLEPDARDASWPRSAAPGDEAGGRRPRGAGTQAAQQELLGMVRAHLRPTILPSPRTSPRPTPNPS